MPLNGLKLTDTKMTTYDSCLLHNYSTARNPKANTTSSAFMSKAASLQLFNNEVAEFSESHMETKHDLKTLSRRKRSKQTKTEVMNDNESKVQCRQLPSEAAVSQ